MRGVHEQVMMRLNPETKVLGTRRDCNADGCVRAAIRCPRHPDNSLTSSICATNPAGPGTKLPQDLQVAAVDIVSLRENNG